MNYITRNFNTVPRNFVSVWLAVVNLDNVTCNKIMNGWQEFDMDENGWIANGDWTLLKAGLSFSVTIADMI